jgi:predicted amidophosphoribosyltransferase
MPLGGLLAPPLCWGCSGPARRGEVLCRLCRGRLHRLAPDPIWLCGVRVWAPVAYSGPARALVGALKFRGAVGVADAMAAQIAANAPDGWLDARGATLGALPGGVTLVPVPLHPRRLGSRGYNQAAAIAAALGERAQLPLSDCLVREGPAVTQVGRHREERRAGPAGVIEARSAVPARVLLVDDVVTTGATLAACQNALRAAGAGEFGAVVFARTLGR